MDDNRCNQHCCNNCCTNNFFEKGFHSSVQELNMCTGRLDLSVDTGNFTHDFVGDNPTNSLTTHTGHSSNQFLLTQVHLEFLLVTNEAPLAVENSFNRHFVLRLAH